MAKFSSIAKASESYRRFARGINASAMRELDPEMDETARYIVSKFFESGGPERKPLKSKIISRSGRLAASVRALKSKLTRHGIEAGVQMGGGGMPYAPGLEKGALISHPGNVGKLQVFKPKGERRLVFTRKTRPHLIPIRAREPLKKGMRQRKKEHLAALLRGAQVAASKAGFTVKVRAR